MSYLNNIFPVKIKNLFRNYGFMMGCYFVYLFALGIFQVLYPEFDLQQYQQSDINQILQENPLKFFFLAVVLAPVIEEGMFRSLIKPSQNELLFFFCIWLVVFVLVFIPLDVFWAVKYSFLLILLTLSFLLLKKLIPDSWQVSLCVFLGKYYKIIWFLTAVVFGMVHIFNYVEGFQLDFVLFLLIIPRVIAGFFFGKLKIENRSLYWPVVLHAMNNATVFILLLPRLL